MPAVSLCCPNCETILKMANRPAEGKKVKCPKCAAQFVAVDHEVTKGSTVVKSAPDLPTAAVSPKNRPPRAEEDDQDDDELLQRSVKQKQGSGSRLLIIGLCIGGGALVAVFACMGGVFFWLFSAAPVVHVAKVDALPLVVQPQDMEKPIAKVAEVPIVKDPVAKDPVAPVVKDPPVKPPAPADEKEKTPPDGWKEVSGGYRRLAYSVWMPADAKVDDKESSIVSKFGQIRVFRSVCERKDGMLFIAGQINLPPMLVKAPPKVRQDFFRDSFLEEFNAKLVEQKNVKLGTMAGKEYVATTPAGLARYRLFGTGVQMFRAVVVGTKEQVESKDADLFFESFKRTPERLVEPPKDK